MSHLCYECGRTVHEDADDHAFYSISEIGNATLMHPTEVAGLVRDVRHLRELLREYGRHAEGCSAAFNDQRSQDATNIHRGSEVYQHKCKCGWDEVKP